MYFYYSIFFTCSNNFFSTILTIFQFVPFREFVKPGQTQLDVSQATLAREVLAEVPTQFMSFMKEQGIKPGQWDPNYVETTEGDLLNTIGNTNAVKNGVENGPTENGPAIENGPVENNNNGTEPVQPINGHK